MDPTTGTIIGIIIVVGIVMAGLWIYGQFKIADENKDKPGDPNGW